MKNETNFKAKVVEWKNDIFTPFEKFFKTEKEAKEEVEKYKGQGKVYDPKGQPVYNKPEKHEEEHHKKHHDNYC